MESPCNCNSIQSKLLKQSRKVFGYLVNSEHANDDKRQVANKFLYECFTSQRNTQVNMVNMQHYNVKDLESLIIQEFKNAFSTSPKCYLEAPFISEYFQQQAPLRLLDGVWLLNLPMYGWSSCKDNERKSVIILSNIYFEELGEGDMEINHHILFDKLLKQARVNLPSVEFLADEDCLLNEAFYQAAIQLSFAYCDTGLFFQEILGYTLCFEMVSADTVQQQKAMQNLKLDDTYHKLHISIDNPTAGGHTRVALEAVLEYMEATRQISSQQQMTEHWQRICRGYSLCQWDPLKDKFEEICSDRETALDKLVSHLLLRKAKFGAICHDNVLVNGECLGTLFSRINNADCDCKKLHFAERLSSVLKCSPYVKQLSPSHTSSLLLSSICDPCNAKMYKVFTPNEIDTLVLWCKQAQQQMNQTHTSMSSTEEKSPSMLNDVALIIARLARAGKGKHKNIQYIELDRLLDQKPNQIINSLKQVNKLESFIRALEHGPMSKLISEQDLNVLKVWHKLGATPVPDFFLDHQNKQDEVKSGCEVKKASIKRLSQLNYYDRNYCPSSDTQIVRQEKIHENPVFQIQAVSLNESTNQILMSMKEDPLNIKLLSARCNYFLSFFGKSTLMNNHSFPTSCDHLKNTIEQFGKKYGHLRWSESLKEIDGYSFTNPVLIWRPTKLGLLQMVLAQQKWQSKRSWKSTVSAVDDFLDSNDIRKAVALQVAVVHCKWSELRNAALIALTLWRTIIVPSVVGESLDIDFCSSVLSCSYKELTNNIKSWNFVLEFLDLLCKALQFHPRELMKNTSLVIVSKL